ncbi:hypothetical protein AAEU32_11000 [Pseudoalteromonas sp. SSDWG2]|uniref:hypothetical protein n=1 Tax=Pseudoalteromonas sp. SSDWG2 TaxID=3139391 RepID=UPI003BAB57DE
MRVLVFIYISILVLCDTSYASNKDVIYINMLADAKEKQIEASKLYIDNLPLIAHYFLYTDKLNEQILNAYDELEGDYNTNVPYAQGICQIKNYEKIKVLLNKGYELEFDYPDSIDCFEWAISHADMHLMEILLPHANKKMQSYLKMLLRGEKKELVDFEKFINELDKKKPPNIKKNSVIIYGSLGTNTKNHILKLYYIGNFSSVLNAIKQLDRVDIDFIFDLNRNFCESISAEHYVKFIRGASKGNANVESVILNTCVEQLMGTGKYEKAKALYRINGLSEEAFDRLKNTLISKQEIIEKMKGRLKKRAMND